MSTSANQASFADAVRFWVVLGFVNFGGPAGQIAMMHRELVERQKWIGDVAFNRALAFCMALPGPEAQQLAIYLGWALHGIPGGIIAGSAFIGPSVIAMMFLSWLTVVHGEIPAVAGTLAGLQAVVVGIVADAVIRVGQRTLREPVRIAIAIAAFVGIAVLNLSFPVVIGAAAVFGLVVLRQIPKANGTGSGPVEPSDAQAHSLASLHRVNHNRTWVIVGATLALWIIPIGALALWRGSDDILTRIALFFTRASFVTFGGAYAVLSYVADVVVNDYQWIDASRMVQGLGLAESTPGPLIMVTLFVGFAAAYGQAPGLSPLVAGILGGLVTTWCTFLPCFLYVLGGAPYVERLADNRLVHAALSGIGCAVVGAIANFALYTTVLTIWPSSSTVNYFAMILASGTFIILRRYSLPTYFLAPIGAVVGAGWSAFVMP